MVIPLPYGIPNTRTIRLGNGSMPSTTKFEMTPAIEWAERFHCVIPMQPYHALLEDIDDDHDCTMQMLGVEDCVYCHPSDPEWAAQFMSMRGPRFGGDIVKWTFTDDDTGHFSEWLIGDLGGEYL